MAFLTRMRILGFRSGRGWKKTIAAIYYIAVLILLAIATAFSEGEYTDHYIRLLCLGALIVPLIVGWYTDITSDRSQLARYALVAILSIAFSSALFSLRGLSPTSGDPGLPVSSTAKKSTATAKPTSTPTASPTAKPTATPRATATATPSIEDMTALEAAQMIAAESNSSLVTTDSVTEEDRRVVINATIGQALTANYAIVYACEYALNVSERLFENVGVDEVTLCYDTEFRDAYGNPLTERALNIVISRATAKKINYEWMKLEIYSKQSSFLDVVDFYSVHRLLEDAIK